MPFHSDTPVGIDPRVDVVFQKLFGDPQHERVLVQFLNDVLTPASPILRAEVRNPFHPSKFMEQKSLILDIEARDETGRTFQVEMQRRSDRGLDQRMLYGWARLYTEQLERGAAYTTLRSVVSVWVCEEDLFPSARQAHLRFGLVELEERFLLTADIRFEVLQLSRWKRDRSDLTGEPARPWFWFLNEAEQWREVPPSINNEALEEAMEILNEFRTDVALNELYRGRLEAERVERGRQEELADALAALVAKDAALERERAEKERERAEKDAALQGEARERAEKEAALAELAALRAALERDRR